MSIRKLALIILVLALAAPVFAAVPPMISYQGKLMQPNGTPVPDGTYSVRFAIYDAPTGGEPLWSETNSSVQVKGGLFATMLGSVINIPANVFDSPNRFFGVKVGVDPEMIPRQQIASSTFSFRSAVAGTVDDGAVTTSKIALGAVTADRLAPGVAVPPGTILMWSGATTNIPLGWKLCDGTVGTPDLRDRFVVGAGLGYIIGATGGEVLHKLTKDEMPSHTHSFPEAAVAGYQLVARPDGDVAWTGAHCVYGTNSAGGDQAHENRPPYYALCFIMKQGY